MYYDTHKIYYLNTQLRYMGFSSLHV